MRRTAILLCLLVVFETFVAASCELLLPLEDPDAGVTDGAPPQPDAAPVVVCGDAACPVVGTSACCHDTHGNASCVASPTDCYAEGGVVALSCDDPSDCNPLTPCCAVPDGTRLFCDKDCNPSAGVVYVCSPDGGPVSECTDACVPTSIADNEYVWTCR